MSVISVYLLEQGVHCLCVCVWWACAGVLGSESIKAAESQLASGLICSSIAANYSQCEAGCRGGVWGVKCKETCLVPFQSM